MRRYVVFVFAIALFTASFSSCENGSDLLAPLLGGDAAASNELGDEENPSVPQISAEEQAELFRIYVSIGDSLTQGCQGANVEENRQYYSWPAQLARQMDTEFNQPLVEYPGVGIPNPEDALVEGWVDTYLGTASIVLDTFLFWKRVDGYENQENINNFGMTGATLDQMLSFDGGKLLNGQSTLICDIVGLANPWIRSVVGRRPDQVGSAVDQAMDRDPTFVSVWAGANDTFFSTFLGENLANTPLEYWEDQWNDLVARIKATKSVKGVLILNIPDTTNAPFLQPINNPFHEVADGVDLPAGSMVPFFVTKTSNMKQVLTIEERAEMQERILEFNEVIERTCEDEGWAMLDTYQMFEDVMTDGGLRLLNADGSESDIFITTEYGTGGMFSLDGIHPTSPGYAHIANLAVKEINKHYGSSIPLLDEVAVWEQDSLCQAPFDPRETDPGKMGNMSFLFNSLMIMLGFII